MKTAELLLAIKDSVFKDPGIMKELGYRDIYEMVYLDLQCRRQLYPASQMEEVNRFFDTLLSDISVALERCNPLLFDRSLDVLISYIKVLPEAEYVSDFVEQANMACLRLEHILKKTLFVIGDSHVGIFSGNDVLSFVPVGHGINTSKQIAGLPFSIFHMGPCLAYNSDRYNSTCRFREKLDFLLSDIIEPDEGVIFALGWIDLRVHVFKQSRIRSCTYEEVVDDVLENYVSMMKRVKHKGYRVSCFGPIGTLSEKSKMDDKYEESGTEEQRNRATAYFTDKLAKMCADEGIGFASIFSKLITDDWRTKLDCLCDDGCHLGRSEISLIMEELEKKNK